MLHHATLGENKLLCGEVLSILRAMSTRSGLPELAADVVVPVCQLSPDIVAYILTVLVKVMVISIVIDQGRIVQAYWNGQKVVICLSPLYDLDTIDMAPFDLLTGAWQVTLLPFPRLGLK